MVKNVNAATLNETQKKHTEFHFKDRIFNWVVDRYSKHNNEFAFSDRIIWEGTIYTVPGYFSYIIFFALFYFVGNIIYKKYGEVRVFEFFMLLLIWRVNILIQFVKKIDKQTVGGIQIGKKRS